MSETTDRGRRQILIALTIVGALLAAVVVLLVVLIMQNNAAASEVDHERRVEICEAQFGDPYGADLEGTLACIDDLEG